MSKPRANSEPDPGERRRNPIPQRAGAPGKPGAIVLPDDPPRVLVASGSRTERERWAARLSEFECVCVQADTCAAAAGAAAAAPFDVALVSWRLPDGCAVALMAALADTGAPGDTRGTSEAPVVIALGEDPSSEDILRAVRAGAADVLRADAPIAEVRDRLGAAFARAAASAAGARRARRLRRLCRGLNHTRKELARQVGTLCRDLVQAYNDLSSQMVQLGVAGEFNGLVRQELELEGLLRTALEFLLSKVGPTNAAVFLPSGSSDYSLGAYVNYDCGKDAADVLLEHMAGTVAPRLDRLTEARLFTTDAQLAEYLDAPSPFLTDSQVIAFPCRHEGECLAVVVLFRDRFTPFAPAALPTVRAVAGLFGRQLARVIHLHHRHQPKSQWGLGGLGFGQDEDDNGLDLAA